MPVDERLPEPSNPLGMDGIEFIEYATSQPQAFGALLQKLGFAAADGRGTRAALGQVDHGAGFPEKPARAPGC